MLRQRRLGRWGAPIALALLGALCIATACRASPLPLAPPEPTTVPRPADTSAPRPGDDPTPGRNRLPANPPASDESTRLSAAFAAAAAEFGVPESVLLAVAYNETLWEQHGGEPSTSGGYGVMHLIDLPDPTTPAGADGEIDPDRHLDQSIRNRPTLAGAAALIGVDPDVVKRDPAQNIRAGAALLATYARATVGDTPADAAQWYGAVAKYSGASDADTALAFADAVFATIEQGVSRITSDGQRVTLAAHEVSPDQATAEVLHLPITADPVAECPAGLTCSVVPARDHGTGRAHYQAASRPKDGLAIRYLVIHDTEETFSGTIDIFQDPNSVASAHYVIRSADGVIVQMVPTKDVAFHAGNSYFNSHSIGIEHEGKALEGATWFSEPLYQASARLARYLAERYEIPLDRAHIIGHDNVPGGTPPAQSQMHWDPGPFWDWAHFLRLLGAPIGTSDLTANPRIVTINPDFNANTPTVSTCEAEVCHDLPAQGANFVYLRTAPRADAPLIVDRSLSKNKEHPDQGTTRADDWGDQAVAGQSFYWAETQGDWDAIYFGGQLAWFYNPGHANTVAGHGTLITPKEGRGAIPVYGQPAPEASAFPPGAPEAQIPLDDTIPPGQIYVASDRITADYNANYSRPNGVPFDVPIIQGRTQYYQIFFNHRIAFVKADDVEVVAAQADPPTAAR